MSVSEVSVAQYRMHVLFLVISNLLGVNKNVEAKEALKKIKDLHLISSERLKYKLRRLPSPIVKTIIGNLDIFRFVPVCEQAIAGKYSIQTTNLSHHFLLCS